MNALTAYQWYDMFHWYSQNYGKSIEISEITENPFNSGTKRNVVHFGIRKVSDIESEGVVLKQFSQYENSKGYYFTEKRIYNSPGDFKPNLILSIDSQKVLITNYVEKIDISNKLGNASIHPFDIKRNRRYIKFITCLGNALFEIHSAKINIDKKTIRDRYNPTSGNKVYSKNSPRYYESYNRFYRKEANTLCHGDLKMSNILWTGERVVLIDFEMAHFNNPYYDLAAIVKDLLFIVFDRNVLKFKPEIQNTKASFEFLKSICDILFSSYFKNEETVDVEALYDAMVLQLWEYLENEYFFENITFFTNLYIPEQ